MTEASGRGRLIAIGAGHPGAAAAGFLRQYGYAGSITLIGDEPTLPYHRPPLSKGWLTGKASAEALALRSAQYYVKTEIELVLDATVTEIAAASRELTLQDGRRMHWDNLILATGARARVLPVAGASSRGVLTLRNAADAEQLSKPSLPAPKLPS